MMLSEPSSVLLKNAELRQKLANLISNNHTLSSQTLSQADVIITCNEVNERHGTGVITRRIFADSTNIFSIRANNHYGAEHDFGDVSICLSAAGLSRPEVFSTAVAGLNGSTARRVLCIPYHQDEVLLAIAVKELFGIPLCTYIMDDNNVCSGGIADDLMEELLSKSSLRLAISPELRQAYERKYNIKFWLLPPVVSSNLLQSEVRLPAEEAGKAKTGILVGNIWGQRWLNLLRETIRGSGIKIHWYHNGGSKCSWLTFDKNELEEEGIIIHDALPEAELAPVLREYAFAIMPSGTLDETDDNRAVAQLSLPTRIPFILATSNTPIIVLGNNKAASARFVERFQVGTVCGYNASDFRQAVEYVTSPEMQRSMRQKAAAIAGFFSAEGIASWIWQSLEVGEPCDLRFEELMPPLPGDFAYYIEPPVPKDVYEDFVPIYQALKRLKYKGFNPDFVVDVGASTGVWSHSVSKVFPKARFLLIEPLLSRYHQPSRQIYIESNPNFEVLEVIVSNKPGKTLLQVSGDLYSSSLFTLHDAQFQESVEVEVTTLDAIAEEKAISGRGLLKMDVQFAEHLVLEGAEKFLTQIDAVVIELSLLRHYKESKTFLEMLEIMDDLGFRYYDDVGDWRLPVDGTLHNKDGLFMRHELFLYEIS